MWDVAAASVLLEEVRGRVPKMDGSPLDLALDEAHAARAVLHPRIVRGQRVGKLSFEPRPDVRGDAGIHIGEGLDEAFGVAGGQAAGPPRRLAQPG